MKRITKFVILFCILAALLLVACTEEMTQFKKTSAGCIIFSQVVEQDWQGKTRAYSDNRQSMALKTDADNRQLWLTTETVNGIHPQRKAESRASFTRGVPRTTANFYASFGVMMFSYTDADYSQHVPNLVVNEEAKQSGSVYATDEYHYWPSSEYHVWALAYAPFDGNGISLSDLSQAGIPKISYTVPVDVTDQSDLLVATAYEGVTGSRPDNLPLHFKHVLSAVLFKLGDNMESGTITQIELQGVYGYGVYDSTPVTGGWSGQAGQPITNFTVATNFSTTNLSNILITSGEKTLMMIPQTLPDEAKVAVTFIPENGEQVVYTGSIGGMTWEPGRTYVYNISQSVDDSNYIFTINPDVVNDDMIASDEVGTEGERIAAHTVTSYKVNTETNEHEKVAWEVTGYATTNTPTTVWSDECPDWLYLTPNGNGGESSEDITCQLAINRLAASSNAEFLRHANALKAVGQLGTAGTPYDLSLHTPAGADCAETTANCYIVSAPGYYTFPLVYGNARKNGVDNTVAYQSNTFKDYQDNKITQPQISGAASAALLWQTADGLVSEVSLSGGYITFRVSEETICQGNASIAVKDASGTIMWSWHIWVTDEKVWETKAVSHQTNGTTYTYNISTHNLGWVLEPQYYETRRAYIRFRQKESGKTAIMLVRQGGCEYFDGPDAAYYGINPVYQWGRKDPFVIDIFQSEYTGDGQTRRSVGTAIQHPNTYYYINKTYYTIKDEYNMEAYVLILNWQDEDNPDMWNANGTYANGDWGAYTTDAESNTVKTIYDPCPPGLCVGVVNAMNAGPVDFSAWNVDIDARGGKTLDILSPDNDELFFPGMSLIEGSNKAEWHKPFRWSVGFYWASNASRKAKDFTTDTPFNSGAAAFWYFDSSNSHYDGVYGRARGFSVRPVSE